MSSNSLSAGHVVDSIVAFYSLVLSTKSVLCITSKLVAVVRASQLVAVVRASQLVCCSDG